MKKISKEHKEEIMKRIQKAGDVENYETSWSDEGIVRVKKKENIKKGKISRAKGARFELKVREDLETKGFIVDKWSNNVDLEKEKIVPAKRKYNPFRKALVIGTGFPDFIAIKHLDKGIYRVIGVEVKVNGILSKIEKQKCALCLKKKVFSEIWIAKYVKKGRKVFVKYEDFKERYRKKVS